MVNKNDLVSEVADGASLSKADAARAVEAVFETIRELLINNFCYQPLQADPDDPRVGLVPIVWIAEYLRQYYQQIIFFLVRKMQILK